MKVFMRPAFRQTDEGRGGGIRRVVEAELEYLKQYGDYTFINTPKDADLVVLHGGDFYETLPGQPLVAHCHGLYWNEYSWSKWEYELNQKVIQCLKQADAITAPTEWVANVIRRGMWARCDVLPNGIRTAEWATDPSEHLSYVLWNKSRIDPICEIDSLVQLARIDTQHKYVSTLGPDRNTPNNLQVVGRQSYGDAAYTLVQKAGVYLATTRETFGIGTLEALAAGVPIVGWAWGGQAEFIKHKVHGWLCKPGDVEGLREGVAWCLEHRSALTSNCIALAKEYEWSSVIEQYHNLYQQVTNKSKSPVHVSVIIPSYNLGKYLTQAVESVLDQKCEGGYEIIIVDDCSTDGSYELALKLAQQSIKIRVLKTPSNMYLARALNYGIAHAQGDYILCLDADNILPKNTLNQLTAILDTDRSLDIVYGRIQFINEDGTPDSTVGPNGVSNWPPVDFDYQGQMTHKNQIPSTCLYRKRVWERIGGYRPRCRTAEDADFWCRATSYGFTPKRVSNMLTLIYRQRKDSMSVINADWPWEQWYNRRQDITSTNEPVQVSVVIPVGPNHTEIVCDALDSLNAQTFTKWECIIVNDSGKDLPWVPAWAKVINSDQRGVSYARNLGIAAAHGVCFLPLDADDYLAPNCLEQLWAAWLQHKGYAYSDYYSAQRGVQPKLVRVGGDACSKLAQGLPHPVTCLYPVQAWRDVGGFDINLTVGEDWVFAAAVTAEGYCGTYVSEPLLYYRTTEGGNRETLLKGGQLDTVRTIIGGFDVACGCKKGGGVITRAAVQAAAPPSEILANDDLVKLTLIAPDIINQTFKGRATGRAYTFASEGQRQTQYVDRRDAEWFINNLGHQFRLADAITQELSSVAS